MSQTYQQYNYARPIQNSLDLQEELKLYQRRAATSAWYNPSQDANTKSHEGKRLLPQTIYIGEQRPHIPSWEDPAFDVAKYTENKKLYREGKINSDRMGFGHWIGEWQDTVNEYFSELERNGGKLPSYRSAAAGVATTTDFTAVNVIQILGEIIGRDTRQYTLEGAVTRAATPNLTISIDQWQGFTASQDVGEGVEPWAKKGKLSRTTYTLKKDAAMIAVTDEAQMTADRDVFALHVNHAVQDMRRIKAQKIATELEAATDVAGSDWAAFTGEHSTADPVDQLGALADTIELNGGFPDTITSHAAVFRDFVANTHINGGYEPSPGLTFGNRVVNNVPNLPGVTWYIDNLHTSTIATILDKSAVMLLQGPVRTAQYRDEGRGIDLYITRDWNSVKTIDSSLIRNLTGVHS